MIKLIAYALLCSTFLGCVIPLSLIAWLVLLCLFAYVVWFVIVLSEGGPDNDAGAFILLIFLIAAVVAMALGGLYGEGAKSIVEGTGEFIDSIEFK